MPEVQPPSAPDELRLPVVEETAVVGKRTVETGRVRIRTEIDEREEVLRDLLMREDVRIERVAVGRLVEEIPPPREEGDVTIIPIVDEVAVVEKRLVLREELHIMRVRTVEPVEERVTLRSTRPVVERAHFPEVQPPKE
jgi:stress response protein YsnF